MVEIIQRERERSYHYKGKKNTSERSGMRVAEKQNQVGLCQILPLILPQRTLISLGPKMGGKLQPSMITRQGKMSSAFLKIQPYHLPSMHPHTS